MTLSDTKNNPHSLNVVPERVPSGSIEQTRYGCSIGAMYTVSAIEHTIPIVHCGPGCGDKQSGAISFYNGFQGGGYGGGAVIPSTNLTSNDIVFGGNERLHELISATLKIMKADLFVLLTGCSADLVGDDVPSVVGSFQKQGVPIVYAETGGFRGNNFNGHERVVQSIIDQFVGDYSGPKEKGLINVWSVLPYHNAFWRGDLIEIKRILEGIGLRVNILWGVESEGVSEWKNIPKAQFNLVLSSWLGVNIARHLEQKYQQPFLHVPYIPIGARDTRALLRKVAEFVDLDRAKVESFIKREEKYYYRFVGDFSDFYGEYRWGLPAKFAVVGDSPYALSIARFMVNQMGILPSRIILTEKPPEEFRDSIREQFRALASDVSSEVEFIEDGYTIGQKLRETNYGHRPPILFASSWERDVAHDLHGVLIETSFPVGCEVVLDRTYVGYRGALTFMEKIYSSIVAASP